MINCNHHPSTLEYVPQDFDNPHAYYWCDICEVDLSCEEVNYVE